MCACKPPYFFLSFMRHNIFNDFFRLLLTMALFLSAESSPVRTHTHRCARAHMNPLPLNIFFISIRNFCWLLNGVSAATSQKFSTVYFTHFSPRISTKRSLILSPLWAHSQFLFVCSIFMCTLEDFRFDLYIFRIFNYLLFHRNSPHMCLCIYRLGLPLSLSQGPFKMFNSHFWIIL